MSGALISIAVVQVLTILVGLLRAKGLALLLGPADFGVASTIDQVVVTLVTFGGFALPFTAMKFMSHAHSQGEASFQRIASGFLRVLTGLGLVTALVASIVVVLFPTLFGTDLALYQTVMQVAVLGVPSALLLIFLVNTFAASQRPAVGAAINLAGVTALGAAAVAGAWRGGLAGLYLASVVAAVVTSIVGLGYVARKLAVRWRTPNAGVLGELRAQPSILTNAGTFYAAMCASTVAMLILRTTVLGQLGATAAGHLQAAFSLALTVGAVLQPVSNLVLVPLVNREAPAADKCDSANKFASQMMVLLLLGALPVLVVPEILMRLLFSSAFVSAASVLWLFVLWQCVFQLMYVYQQLLVGLDDVLFVGVMSVAGFAAALTLGSPLVRWLGLGGVAIALAVGMTLTGVGLVVRLRVRHRCRISRRVTWRFVGLLAVAAIAGVFFAAPTGLASDTIMVRAAFVLAVLVATWFALAPEERDLRLWLSVVRPG